MVLKKKLVLLVHISFQNYFCLSFKLEPRIWNLCLLFWGFFFFFSSWQFLLGQVVSQLARVSWNTGLGKGWGWGRGEAAVSVTSCHPGKGQPDLTHQLRPWLVSHFLEISASLSCPPLLGRTAVMSTVPTVTDMQQGPALPGCAMTLSFRVKDADF